MQKHICPQCRAPIKEVEFKLNLLTVEYECGEVAYFRVDLSVPFIGTRCPAPSARAREVFPELYHPQIQKIQG